MATMAARPRLNLGSRGAGGCSGSGVSAAGGISKLRSSSVMSRGSGALAAAAGSPGFGAATTGFGGSANGFGGSANGFGG
jgi:hypothetical protein